MANNTEITDSWVNEDGTGAVVFGDGRDQIVSHFVPKAGVPQKSEPRTVTIPGTASSKQSDDTA